MLVVIIISILLQILNILIYLFLKIHYFLGFWLVVVGKGLVLCDLHEIKVVLVILENLKALVIDLLVAQWGLKWDWTDHVGGIEWPCSHFLASCFVEGENWSFWGASAVVLLVFTKSIFG